MYWVIEACVSGQPPPIISILASILERVVSSNEEEATSVSCNWKVTVFHGLRPPSISIINYLQRMFKYANCSPSCFVVAYAYIDRFLQHHQAELLITSLSVHRLLITSVMIAAKFMDDVHYNNAYYAKVGGVTTMEINRLELEFLFALRFRLQITVGVFEHYCCLLQKEMLIRNGYAIEKPLLPYWCSSGENALQDQTKESQPPIALCSYAGV